MIDHDGCEGCKHFSTTICVPEESPCFDCENAHKRKTLVDKYEPMTNADRIRSMSDEELAEFINMVSQDSIDTVDYGSKCYSEIWERETSTMEWLQSEVK